MTSHTTAPAAPEPRRFTFQQDHLVRVVERDGEPWFIAADVCAALGIQNPSQVVARLDEDERAMLNIGRQGSASIISESGLYTLILRCRDATTPGTVAHRFRKWVTAEVLPALRRTGRYELVHTPSPAPAPKPVKPRVDVEDDERLTPRQCAQLRDAVHAYVIAAEGPHLSDLRRSGEYQYLYRRLHRHFGVTRYQDIPSSRFQKALHLLRPSTMENELNAPDRRLAALRELLLAVRADLVAVSDQALAAIGMIEETCGESGLALKAARREWARPAMAAPYPA
ncbi:BRO family protein, partial [Nevskia sp.]|uniref:BRO family protein n=1 Tax=Nevskia sp. TaxID=1929292 RepID=UPI0026001E48